MSPARHAMAHAAIGCGFNVWIDELPQILDRWFSQDNPAPIRPWIAQGITPGFPFRITDGNSDLGQYRTANEARNALEGISS